MYQYGLSTENEAETAEKPNDNKNLMNNIARIFEEIEMATNNKVCTGFVSRLKALALHLKDLFENVPTFFQFKE